MRARRHQSGSSNMPRPASAVASGGTPLTATTHATTTTGSPRHAPRRHVVPATARRAEPTETQQDAISDGGASKRRIHSARAERPRGSSSVAATPTPTPGFGRAHVDATSSSSPTPTLPQLNLTTSLAPVEWAVKVAAPNASDATHNKYKNKTAAADAESVSTTVKPVPEPLRRILKDFSALLRDRYDGKRSLRLAFLNWDRDKDGQLSLQEIRDMIHSLGLTKKLGHPSVEAIVDHVAAATPSQSLKYNDFCGYVYGTRQAAPAEDTAKKSATGSDTKRVEAKAGSEPVESRPEPNDDNDVVLSSDRALYPDSDHVVNLLRKKYEGRQLRQIFRHWDTDKDGGVTVQEVDGNLRRQGIRLPSSQLRELFDRHDANKTGKLMYREFVEMIVGPVTVEHHNLALRAHLRDVAQQQHEGVDAYQILKSAALANPLRRIDEEAIGAAVQEKLKVFAPRIHDAYTAFDDDHNGNLSYTEFRQGLDVLGLHFTEREFLHIAAMVDTDGSGEISFREFTTLFSRKHQRGVQPGETVGHAVAGETNDCDAMLAKQRVTLPKGRFDFTHLTRKAKVPTRFGKTPYPNTKDLLSPTTRDGGTQDTHEREQFRTETSLYGSGQTPRGQRHQTPSSGNASGSATPSLTLGQEEKQRKDAHYVKRLERIRAAQLDYAAQTAPLQHNYEATQQRRAETLHRHQQRYHASVEENLRPHAPQYAPHVAERARQPTVPPYINK